MRLRYSYTSESPTGTLHGFTDSGTGSSIGIEDLTGAVVRLASGDTAAGVSAAEARLDLIEASFRRPPDYAASARAVAQPTAELNAAGIPILFSKGIFEGGRTYEVPGLIPSEPSRLLAVPTGVRFEYEGGAFEGDSRDIFYVFRDDEGRWDLLVLSKSGHVATFGDDTDPDALALANAVRTAFRPSPDSSE